MINPTEFVAGEQYTNRKGTFTVVALHPPTMTVRFENGVQEDLDIAIQQRILSNMTLPPRTPEPPPRRRTGPLAQARPVVAPAAPKTAEPKAPRATRSAAAGPASTAPRTARRSGGAAPSLSTTIGQIAAMTGKEQQQARHDALMAVLASPDAFTGFVERSRQAEAGGHLQAFSLEQVDRFHRAEPEPTRQFPDQYLSYAIAQNRAYLAREGQEILTWRYPLYEAGIERYVIDLLCYDENAHRAMLVCTRVKSTQRYWLWQALLDNLRTWVAVTSTTNFAAALDGYAMEAPPALVVLAPASFWAENAPGAGAHVTEVEQGHLLNRRMLAAVEQWMRIPVELLQVPDDWLRTADQLDHPHISTAPFPRSAHV
jgi:hypothetical protein